MARDLGYSAPFEVMGEKPARVGWIVHLHGASSISIDLNLPESPES
jgi:hypothetical protein